MAAGWINLCLAVSAVPAAILLGVAAQAPVPGRPVLVIAPGAEAEVLATAAGGTLLAGPALPLGFLAASADPGFAARLGAAGAWMVIDAGRLALLCGDAS